LPALTYGTEWRGEDDREAFGEMLEYELRGRGELPADEMRRIAVNTWRQFLKDGWPRS